MTMYEETKKWMTEALKIAGKTQLPIRIQWSHRMTSTLGRAWSSPPRIKFSVPLHRKATKEQRRENVFHEVAHIIADLRYGRCGHDYRWRKVMRELGYPHAQRCHSLKPEGGVEISCPCGAQITLSRIRYRKAWNGRVKYLCGKCKRPITLGGKNG